MSFHVVAISLRLLPPMRLRANVLRPHSRCLRRLTETVEGLETV